VNAPAYSLAAILAAGDPERLYSGLSLLVSAAAGGELCAALATFRALDALLDPELASRAPEAKGARCSRARWPSCAMPRSISSGSSSTPARRRPTRWGAARRPRHGSTA
jgi:peroxiredoxin family protein